MDKYVSGIEKRSGLDVGGSFKKAPFRVLS